MNRFALACLAILVICMGMAGTGNVHQLPNGITAPNDPIQTAATGVRPWKKNGYLIRPLARFKINARVLLTDHYSWDRESQLAPVDLTLGWGALSDTAVLSTLELSHGYRHYRWVARDLVLPTEEINDHMANMHIIPADAHVEGKLRKVIPGDIVTIDGYLVEAATADGWSWRSSLTRQDSGNGACEVLWAERIH